MTRWTTWPTRRPTPGIASAPALLLLAMLLVPAALAAQRATPTAEWAALDRFRAENATLPPAGPDRVVFMGNSITQEWAPRFPVLFPGKPYVGRGISGQTTAQMLVRFRQDVIALEPAVVVLLAGTNDIAENLGPASLDEIAGNLASMVELAQANGIRVVLCSVLPVHEYPWRRGLAPAPKIIALNERLRAYAARRGAVWVDLHSAMRDERGGMRRELARDGVHPTDAGYEVMSRLVEEGIAAALRGR